MPNFKFQILNFKFLTTSYMLLAISLFLYSYTQVDLNLTLSQWSVWQVIQTSFQYIGWFQRPLSTTFYLSIILLFTIYYLLFLWLIKQRKLSVKQFWWTIIIASVILLFSYNAFSYDLFNYMFDARIVTLHQENPYLHKALDYPADPWINFMRWTHRVYPYGPVWLGLTIPLSFIGFQFFLPTLFLFKSLMAASFLGTVFFIGRILEKISPSSKLFGMAVFAFNPLVVIESLVSAHHDIVMMFFSVCAIFFLLDKKYIRAFLLLFLSIGIKFSTVLLLPIFVWIILMKIQNIKIDWEKMFRYSLVLMLLAVILASIRTELQPWYLLWVLPLTPLLTRKKELLPASTIISLGLLLHYVPFLYTGNWNPPIPTIKNFINNISIAVALLLAVWYRKAKMIQ